ncbi:MAG: ABC transporter permease [Saprospiraceae bacterium]|nr:ABC transporter permease [Saprospiraceae bacterium]
MKIVLRIIAESISQALHQLRANKLRSFLSLLGVSIGIFCIIGVQSAVDSLESNVRGSIEKLGNDVIYVQKISWAEDPGDNFFKYMRRPNIAYDDYKAVAEKVKSAEMVSFHVGVGDRVAKYLTNSTDIFYIGVTYDFGEMFKFEYDKGRYFSQSEYNFGANKAVLGYEVADRLFGSIEPIGKTIKVNGRKLEVIGVLQKSGESLVNVMNFDEGIIITYELARKIVNLKPNHPFGNTSLNIKATEGVSVNQLRDEVTGVMRAHRRLKPKEESNFSLNELSIISGFLNSFFGVLNMLGWFIGGFAILVGMFSVANIMFVSVKERTNIIGIKKALGAKRYVILLEFLIEASILCLIGGAAGLILVAAITAILSQAINFELAMSVGNILFGVILSMIVGVAAGMIPALQASRMDPVVAMRAK